MDSRSNTVFDTNQPTTQLSKLNADGLEDIKQRLEAANHYFERAQVVAEAVLQYGETGRELVLSVGVSECVTVVMQSHQGKEYYRTAYLEVMQIDGYESPYWWVTEAEPSDMDFDYVKRQTERTAKELGIIILWEVSHLVKVQQKAYSCEYTDRRNVETKPFQPMSENGSLGRYKFTSASDLRDLKRLTNKQIQQLGEPDWIGKHPHYNRGYPVKFYLDKRVHD